MTSPVPIIAGVSLLLLTSCNPFSKADVEERQERAAEFLERTAEGVAGGVRKAREVGGRLAETTSGALQKIQATASDLSERAEQVQEGIEKVTGAVSEIKEGTEEVKEGWME